MLALGFSSTKTVEPSASEKSICDHLELFVFDGFWMCDIPDQLVHVYIGRSL